jgi:hypothetical protein
MKQLVLRIEDVDRKDWGKYGWMKKQRPEVGKGMEPTKVQDPEIIYGRNNWTPGIAEINTLIDDSTEIPQNEKAALKRNIKSNIKKVRRTYAGHQSPHHAGLKGDIPYAHINPKTIATWEALGLPITHEPKKKIIDVNFASLEEISPGVLRRRMESPLFKQKVRRIQARNQEKARSLRNRNRSSLDDSEKFYLKWYNQVGTGNNQTVSKFEDAEHLAAKKLKWKTPEERRNNYEAYKSLYERYKDAPGSRAALYKRKMEHYDDAEGYTGPDMKSVMKEQKKKEVKSDLKPEDRPSPLSARTEQTEREIIEEEIGRKGKMAADPRFGSEEEFEAFQAQQDVEKEPPVEITKGKRPLIEDTGDARHAEEVYRRDQQGDLTSLKASEFGVEPMKGDVLSVPEVKSLNADDPAQLMNMMQQKGFQPQQPPQPEQTENILDVSVSEMGVQPAGAPPINQPGFSQPGVGGAMPGQLSERPTMVAKKGGEVKKYQLGDMVEGPQMLTKGEAGGDIEPREGEVGIEGAPKGAQQEVTQEQIEEVKKKFPEEVNKLSSMPSAQEGMQQEEVQQEETQQEAVTGLDQDIYQKDTLAIQGHLDDIRSGKNVEEARASLAQYPVEQLAEFRDVRTSPALPMPGAQTPPDRLELLKAQGQAKQLAAQSAVGVPNPETVTQTMQLQKQQQQSASSGIDQLIQSDLELKKRLNEELDRAYQAEKDIRKVEPNQFFHSMSTPAKIAASIGMLVAGFGSQTAGGVKAAYNIMNAAIQQDIENQKLDREHQLIVAKESRSRAQDAIDKYSKLAMKPETKAKLMELKQKLEQDKNLLEAAKQKEFTKKMILNGISTGKIPHIQPWMRDLLWNKSQQSEQFKLSGRFNDEIDKTKAAPIVSAYRKLHSLVHNNPTPGGPGDIAIVFSFMKMLDPNSVVREGEFKTAETATPRAVQFARAWNKFFNGGRFIEADRKRFVDTTRMLVQPAMDDLKFVKEKYVKIAQRYGYPPSLIVGPTVNWSHLPGGKRELRIQKRMKKDGLTRKEAEAIDKSITKR